MKAKVVVGLISVFMIGVLLSACSEETEQLSDIFSSKMKKDGVINLKELILTDPIVTTCNDCEGNTFFEYPPTGFFNVQLISSPNSQVENCQFICSDDQSLLAKGFLIKKRTTSSDINHQLTITPTELHWVNYRWEIYQGGLESMVVTSINQNVINFRTRGFTPTSTNPVQWRYSQYPFIKLTVMDDVLIDHTYYIFLAIPFNAPEQ